MYITDKQSGFSILQVLLVMSLMLIIASMALPSLYQFQSGVMIDTVAAEIGQNLRRAQTRAMIGYDNSNWGVYFSDGVYTIFSGNSYALRNIDKDEDYQVANAIKVVTDFNNEIVFISTTGVPDNSGQITLTNITAEEFIISINNIGVIEYR